MRTKIVLIVIFLGVSLFSSSLAFCAGKPERITAAKLKAMIEKNEQVTLIDVRTPEEYNSGYIAGAINIPLDNIPLIKDFPYKGAIVLYCTAGVRSLKAKKALNEKGIKNILDLEGGINAWIKNGGKVITSQKPSTKKEPDKSEEYSSYPKDFVVPKGVCEQGIEPAMVFTTSK